jgi:hypothetical protein
MMQTIGIVTHGMSRTKVYKVWTAMIQRCNNTKNSGYKWYGARGIKVCSRWLKFENFIDDMGLPPSPKHSIDRKNNEKNYSPNNCQWSTPSENSNNKRINHRVTYLGKTKTLAEWGKITGLHPEVIRHRLTRTDDLDRVFSRDNWISGKGSVTYLSKNTGS